MTPPSIGDSASCSSLTQTMFWPFTHTHTHTGDATFFSVWAPAAFPPGGGPKSCSRLFLLPVSQVSSNPRSLTRGETNERRAAADL